MASYYATESIDRLMDRDKLFSDKIELNKFNKNSPVFEKKKNSSVKIHLKTPVFKNRYLTGNGQSERIVTVESRR